MVALTGPYYMNDEAFDQHITRYEALRQAIARTMYKPWESMKGHTLDTEMCRRLIEAFDIDDYDVGVGINAFNLEIRVHTELMERYRSHEERIAALNLLRE